MNKIEATIHILTNPGTRARRKIWDSRSCITADSDGGIFDEDGSRADLNAFYNEGWEIVKQPIKYETYIWLAVEPKLGVEGKYFLERFTGCDYSSPTETSIHNRKIKITVEEV